MIKCISIDGTDGSGKTTIVEELKLKYNVILVPRFYCMQMVPINRTERKDWFLRTSPLISTAIYISGHRLRFRAAAEFKKGMHYQIYDSMKEPLVVLDRGPLSVKAFSYAALKETTLTDNEIEQFITDCFLHEDPEFLSSVIDFSFLLFDKHPDCIKSVLARRQYDERDKQLTYWQHEYYKKHFNSIKSSREISIISPMLPKEEVFKIILRQIEAIDCVSRL